MDKDKLHAARAGLAGFLDHALPRMLTQVDRDPLSPTYGSFDRSWWHYRMRDFSSIILQQGGYALQQAARTATWARYRAGLEAIAAASVRFWNTRAVRPGAFEEYYPWEQGYPPLAFSTLAVAKLVASQVVDAEAVKAGASVAARQLVRRFEGQAANQQVAGLAALAWLRRSFPALVADADFERLSRRTLSLQRPEGWFVEYDGPDLGYLSVTLDCLWDLWDATGDRVYLDSIHSAIGFMEPLVDLMEGSVGMHNARNTDYIVPYGLLRAALDAETASTPAARLFAVLFRDVASPEHFLYAIDDRYLVHYVGHSIVRATLLPLPDLPPFGVQSPPQERVEEDAGYALIRTERVRAMIALRKGGTFSARWPSGQCSDFGWTVESKDGQLVSHWWHPDWRFKREGARQFTVEGPLVPHKHLSNTPYRHMLLRVVSRILGRHLIDFLKRRLIFRSKLSSVRFCRAIQVHSHVIEVTDRFFGVPSNARLIRSPRASKRHVASADSFHWEDISLLAGVKLDEEVEGSEGEVTVRTTYRPLATPEAEEGSVR